MARNSPCPGIFTTISWLNTTANNHLHGMTVRVTGRISSHDYVQRRATLRDVDRKEQPEMTSQLVVDTSLVEPLPACQQIQLIGEMDSSEDGSGSILHARVARDVDALDMAMYGKAMKLRNEYLSTHNALD